MRNNITNMAGKGLAAVAVLLLLAGGRAGAGEPAPMLELQPLIDEALKNNHEVYVSEAKWKAAAARIGQAGSLPDPMIMIGYQNEGWDKYTYGEMEGAQWMYSVSQMFPFPGKRSLKEQMAARDADNASAMHRAARLGTVARVKELYFDLFLVHKDLELVRERSLLFSRVEDAALARYAAGMAQQQEVLMAQTEKYMLLERETMLEQKRLSLEAMLTAVVGREGARVQGRPAEPKLSELNASVDDLVRQAIERSPEIRSRQSMLGASQAGISMAEKEYYPDVTITGTVAKRSGPFEDMWSLTAAFNIPLYYQSRQRQALAESRAMSSAAIHDLAGIKAMLESTVRDTYAMVRSAEQLTGLYRDGLIPRTRQDFEQALAGYRSGKAEGSLVINRLKTLLDYEVAYWSRLVDREKAIARLEALTGNEEPGDRSQESGTRRQE